MHCSEAMLELYLVFYDHATVREWNNLNLSVRNLDTLSKFKKAIRSSISMPIPRHYSYGLLGDHFLLSVDLHQY
jgi:hypothetical protein